LKDIEKSIVAAIKTAKKETSSDVGPLPVIERAEQYLEERMKDNGD